MCLFSCIFGFAVFSRYVCAAVVPFTEGNNFHLYGNETYETDHLPQYNNNSNTIIRMSVLKRKYIGIFI